jgi:putative sterol carrier protein
LATMKEIVEQIRARASADPAKTAGINGTYQFHLTGEGGGSFYAAIANGAADVQEGQAPDAQATITLSTADFLDLVTGKLSPVAAFMSGRLKVGGDMGLVMKLQQLLR